MSTTSLKLPDDLKKRVAIVARGSKKTAHAFMVDLIKEGTERAEARADFVRSALKAREDFEKTRHGYALEDVHKYVLAKAKGTAARKPRLKKWPR